MKHKIYSACLIFSIVSFLAFIFQSCKTDHIRSHTFLIPANFEGTLRIIYDEDCGIKPKVEDGNEILKFPKSGILILNSNSYADAGDKYYLIDNKGNRTTVTEILDSNASVKRMPAIFAGMLTVSGYTYHNSEVEIKGITYKDFRLYRTNDDTIKNFTSIQNKDSLSNAAVKACRSNL